MLGWCCASYQALLNVLRPESCMLSGGVDVAVLIRRLRKGRNSQSLHNTPEKPVRYGGKFVKVYRKPDWRYDMCGIRRNHTHFKPPHFDNVGETRISSKETHPLLKLALVFITFPCVNLCEGSSATHWACLALSSSRAVIKEELQWADSQRAVSAQTSNSSLKNPLTSTQRPHSPALSNPKSSPSSLT